MADTTKTLGELTRTARAALGEREMLRIMDDAMDSLGRFARYEDRCEAARRALGEALAA